MQTNQASTSDSDAWAGLIQRIAAHQDKEAFAALYSHFAPKVTAWLVKSGTTPDEADEISQEAMIKVWQKAKQFDGVRASSNAWIFSIARNQRIDVIRKKNVRGRTQEGFVAEYPAHVEAPAQPDHELHQSDVQKNVAQGMATLPAAQQEVITLSFFEGLSHRQIADRLELPIGTVKSRIRLAFAQLKTNLADTV